MMNQKNNSSSSLLGIWPFLSRRFPAHFVGDRFNFFFFFFSEKGKQKTKQASPEKLLFKTVEHCNCKEQKPFNSKYVIFTVLWTCICS